MQESAQHAMVICHVAIDAIKYTVPADLGPSTVVSTGYFHTCTFQADGTLVYFGRNDFGQCTVPADLGPITAVAAGYYYYY